MDLFIFAVTMISLSWKNNFEAHNIGCDPNSFGNSNQTAKFFAPRLSKRHNPNRVESKLSIQNFNLDSKI
jgi:hypothetical protein